MPSRKRLKGKQRKATAAARQTVDESEKIDWSQLGRLASEKIDWSQLSAKFDWSQIGRLRSGEKCNHGCPVIAPHHPVSALVDDMLEAASDESKFISESVKLSIERHPQLWNDKDTCMMAVDILISFTVSCFLSGGDIEAGETIALTLLYLTNYDGLGGLDAAAYASAALRRDIVCGNNRDVLRFYSKRIPCSCLKDLYKQSKRTLSKDGCCQNCKRVFNRSDLMVCGDCRVIQFCSKECQRECWPEHKLWCSGYVSWKRSTVETRA